MSVVRPKPPEDPLQYDPEGVFVTGDAGEHDLASLGDALDAARAAVLDDLARFAAGETRPGEACEPSFMTLPERLLTAYHSARPSSELFAILGTARRLRETADRIVVLGSGGSSLGARALFEACCHPFHNELGRGERGGRPRLSVVGSSLDNDSAQGLLDLLGGGGRSTSGGDLLDRWALLVVSDGGDTLDTALATRLFLRALLDFVGGDERKLAELLVPITGTSGRLADLARAIGCRDVFQIPDGVRGGCSVFSAAALLPAATVGIDVVRLLQGAAAMNRRFREAPVADNPVLRFVGVSHLAERRMRATTRVLSIWSDRLEALGWWYGRLLTERLGRAGNGPTSLTTVATRDPHVSGVRHGMGWRHAVTTNLLVGEPRCDRITLPPLGAFAADADHLDDLVGRSWPELLAAAAAGTKQACARDGRPMADLMLPRIDEHAVGQLLQFLMLATIVEERLVGTAPSGRPGDEADQSSMTKRPRP